MLNTIVGIFLITFGFLLISVPLAALIFISTGGIFLHLGGKERKKSQLSLNY